ncbi:HAMP domain-containing sensor histidine kinase [uncultured Sphingomonas sp.]|uniref:sensor histidine kinase n=1 Tax=uncultured Sphingomonas sp. TaxID=158754 RepID=UPI0025988F98|nr:HAMP domain-containing sensor histidine kinase [uncultured Sphingomonas sp.]
MSRLSLHARLLLVAGVSGLAALAFAAFAIGGVLERFVMQGLDERLDAQVTVLARAIDAQGRLDPARVVDLPGFSRTGSGWGWRVRTPAGEWRLGARIGDVADADRPPPRDRHPPLPGPPPPSEASPVAAPPPPAPIMPGDVRGADGEPIHLRRLTMPVAGGTAEVVAAAPRALVRRPIRAAIGTLSGALALLGLGLAAATWVQLRVGLRPIRRLQDAVARVRAGDDNALPLDQPRELVPLAAEINALIAQNAAGLANARHHVANLAHGLKTPLATLALRLDREQASAEARGLVAELGERIAHHLRRARSAAPSAGTRARTELASVTRDVAGALRHIHAEREIAIRSTIPAQAAVAVERQDLEEMLGNLIDNACRHASAIVEINATPGDAIWAIDIADDGPGLSPAARAQALQPGVRLDERQPGYGFGLAIVAELAELYGGTLTLGAADMGGLRARLTLPRLS